MSSQISSTICERPIKLMCAADVLVCRVFVRSDRRTPQQVGQTFLSVQILVRDRCPHFGSVVSGLDSAEWNCDLIFLVGRQVTPSTSFRPRPNGTIIFHVIFKQVDNCECRNSECFDNSVQIFLLPFIL